MSSKPRPLVERILWHVPNVGRLKLERNLETNEVSEFFEIEYLAEGPEGDFRSTAFSKLDNPEMPVEFLQQFITHTSNEWTKRQGAKGPFGVSATDLLTGKPFWAEVIQHLEQALDLMFAELGRRADGIKT